MSYKSKKCIQNVVTSDGVAAVNCCCCCSRKYSQTSSHLPCICWNISNPSSSAERRFSASTICSCSRACLVAAVTVEVLAARKPARGEPLRLLRQREHVAAANFRVKAERRHIAAQLLPLLHAPIFDHVPARIEHVVVVKQADP